MQLQTGDMSGSLFESSKCEVQKDNSVLHVENMLVFASYLILTFHQGVNGAFACFSVDHHSPDLQRMKKNSKAHCCFVIKMSKCSYLLEFLKRKISFSG